MKILSIECFNEEHIERVSELEKECFSLPWSAESLRSELGNPFSRFFVAVCNGEIAGYIGAHNILGEVYITNVAVFESFRNKGIGSALIKRLLNLSEREGADFVTLEVRKSNSSAIALYEKSGFSRVGERIGFYESPKEDAILMTYFFEKKKGNI